MQDSPYILYYKKNQSPSPIFTGMKYKKTFKLLSRFTLRNWLLYLFRVSSGGNKFVANEITKSVLNKKKNSIEYVSILNLHFPPLLPHQSLGLRLSHDFAPNTDGSSKEIKVIPCSSLSFQLNFCKIISVKFLHRKKIIFSLISTYLSPASQSSEKKIKRKFFTCGKRRDLEESKMAPTVQTFMNSFTNKLWVDKNL